MKKAEWKSIGKDLFRKYENTKYVIYWSSPEVVRFIKSYKQDGKTVCEISTNYSNFESAKRAIRKQNVSRKGCVDGKLRGSNYSRADIS